MFPKDQPISDERAVEASQHGQSVQTNFSSVNVGYYEPHKLTDLAKHGRLYIIADGVSGAASGQVASQYAIQKLLYNFYTRDSLDPQSRLLEAIQLVNRDIFDRNSQNPERRPLTTTLTAALLHNNKLLIANVGDSTAYVVWGQDIERVDWGTAPPPAAEPEDAPVLLLPARATAPAENQVKKAKSGSLQQVKQLLGLDKDIKINTFSRRLFPADIVVLCSGGLTGYVTEAEIARAVSRHAPEQAIPRLIALATERGNHDPVAVSITRLLSSAVALRPPAAMALPAAPKWSDWDNIAKPSDKAPPPPAADPPSQPGSTPTPSATETQPLVTPKTVTDQYSITAQQLSQQQPRWRWRSSLFGIIIVLILCALPVLAWRYLLTPEMVAAVPFLGTVEGLVNGGAVSPDVALTLPESTESEAINETEETAPEVGVQEDSTSTPTATITSAPTLVAESNSPIPTPEATVVSPANTPETIPTRTASPTPSPITLATIELPADCGNRARFFGDETIPDGTQFAPGERFEKTWSVLNAETCPWGPGYTVRFVGGDIMGAEPEVPLLDVVQPEASADIRIAMIAPASPGSYRGEWQLFDLNGDAFGPLIYLQIEVAAPDLTDLASSDQNTIFDFVENADKAIWLAGGDTYTVLESEINETLQLPPLQGVVARGTGLLRGNTVSEGNVLLTYPHRDLGTIEGNYQVNTSLQPTDALVATLGYPKLSILSDDGVTFEVVFTPNGGSEQMILSEAVLYQDSPITKVVPLTSIESDQTGNFTLRVVGGQSLNQDWAVWIDARIVRP